MNDTEPIWAQIITVGANDVAFNLGAVKMFRAWVSLLQLTIPAIVNYEK